MKYFKIFLNPLVLPAILLFFLFFLILCIGGSSSSHETVVSSELGVPFDKNVQYVITSPFGGRDSPLGTGGETHTGIDLSAPRGTEILSSADGYVVSYKVTTGTGESVTIEHNVDGIPYRTVYYHMLQGSVVVTEGQEVKKGQKIGIIGMSGTQVTGVHLHFEVRSYDNDKKKYIAIDPQYIFE